MHEVAGAVAVRRDGHDLGRDVTRFEFKADPKGFDKPGLDGRIDALKKVRDKMNR